MSREVDGGVAVDLPSMCQCVLVWLSLVMTVRYVVGIAREVTRCAMPPVGCIWSEVKYLRTAEAE